MTKFKIITGKTIEKLNKNIKVFLEKNPNYQPYSIIHQDMDCQTIKYQNFVKYDKQRKSQKKKTKRMHKKTTYKKK